MSFERRNSEAGSHGLDDGRQTTTYHAKPSFYDSRRREIKRLVFAEDASESSLRRLSAFRQFVCEIVPTEIVAARFLPLGERNGVEVQTVETARKAGTVLRLESFAGAGLHHHVTNLLRRKPRGSGMDLLVPVQDRFIVIGHGLLIDETTQRQERGIVTRQP